MEMASGGRAVEQMSVFGDRAGKDREVDLAVVVDGHNAHNSLRRFVAGEKHRSGSHTVGIARIGQG